MNRHDRRAKKARQVSIPNNAKAIAASCDIQVDGKERAVMIFANAVGRKVVEGLWPDVQWATDETFAAVHDPDWLFTHVRVTKLPPDLEARTPLAFAAPDAIAFAVAMALQRRAARLRVVHWTGTMPNIKANKYDGMERIGGDYALFVEHVPVGLHTEEKPTLQ